MAVVIQTREPVIFVDDAEGPGGRPQRPPNFMGRSVTIVGPQTSPDPHDDPHARVRRGELGPIVQNYYFNRFVKDPLNRMGHNTANADSKAVLASVLARSGRGSVNPEKLDVPDASVMTEHVKRVARFLGADAIGIAPTLPEYVNDRGASRTEDEHMVTAASGETPEEISRKYPYAICFLVAWDYDMVQAHRHHIGDATYHFAGQKANVLGNNLAGYIREMGYQVRQGGASTIPMMLAAGLGELGRNGIVISEKFGSRVHPHVLLTDLPLVADKPIDIGVADFCKVCRKCAIACPTNSISHDINKKLINGVEKYAINWKTCYAVRPHTLNLWHNCLTCVAACPYTKPNVWWRTLTLQTIRTTPVRLRPLLVRGLVALDDKIWGKLPRKRVRWLGYDTGVKINDSKCSIAGCSCHENDHPEPEGQYPPFKENARRFYKDKARK
jgi:reductive dehalogenase